MLTGQAKTTPSVSQPADLGTGYRYLFNMALTLAYGFETILILDSLSVFHHEWTLAHSHYLFFSFSLCFGQSLDRRTFFSCSIG